MPFKSQKPALELNEAEKRKLDQLSHSRTAKHACVIRSRILLGFAAGETISAMARRLAVNRARVERCVRKALNHGIDAALEDLPRRGRPRVLSDEAIAWVVETACRKPVELGYAAELWTYRELAAHLRREAWDQGFPELQRAGKSLVHGILNRHDLRPHKIRYYLEERDPDFERKKAEILLVYREVAEVRESGDQGTVTTISLDEKPGIQALGNTRPDQPPQAGQRRHWSRDPEYVRLGTLSLLGGIDLHTGRIHAIVREHHRSREFIELLELLHAAYPDSWKIRLVLDNHSSHLSKETRRYLDTRPNRFEFVFTPKHGSWLNLIEVFFSKMTRSFLRGIRVDSKDELRQRIERYLEEVNREAVIFRWKFQEQQNLV